MAALSRTLDRMRQINQMCQKFSQNSSNFYSMKPGFSPNSGVGLPSGGASLRSSGVSFPGNKKKKKPLPPTTIQEAVEDDSGDEDVTQPTPEEKSKFLSPKVIAAAECSAKSNKGLSGPCSNYLLEMLQARMTLKVVQSSHLLLFLLLKHKTLS